MIKHENKSGDCQKCEQIFNKYPGFDAGLKFWFKRLQKNHPEAHISCAGRGATDQMILFNKNPKASKAMWLESPHNYSLAIDVFQLKDGVYNLDQEWFDSVVAPALTPNLNWLGKRGSSFYERPHIEIAVWEVLVKQGRAKPVE